MKKRMMVPAMTFLKVCIVLYRIMSPICIDMGIFESHIWLGSNN